MAIRAPDGTDTPATAGTVVVHDDVDHGLGRHYERMVHARLAERLAGLLGRRFMGAFDASVNYPGPLYIVPSGTLVAGAADALGIRGREDLFGGVVPHPFVATKAISQPLIDPDADAPPGWSHAFAQRVHDAVLRGYTVFTLEDARRAGARLLAAGPFRIKPVHATGGAGQEVLTSMDALDAVLDAIDPTTLSRDGLVLEENLSDVITHSVGCVWVGDLVASYYGTQHTTRSNRGEQVYGGSDLVVVRGGFEALDHHTHTLPEGTAIALREARAYHEAALECYPGLIVSRSNYDVAQGVDAQGRRRVGVLEQSWRIGGASPAEIAALEVFRREPRRRTVRVSCVEVHGEEPELPAEADIVFNGIDSEVGPITLYTVMEA